MARWPQGAVGRDRRWSWRALAAGLAGLLLGAITVLSLSDDVPAQYRRLAAHLPEPVRTTPLLSFSSVWGLHFVAFASLTFVTVVALRAWWARVAAASALMACGWLIEVAQRAFTSVRNYQTVDLAADARGVIIGFTLAVCTVTLRSRLRPRPAQLQTRIEQSGRNGGHRR